MIIEILAGMFHFIQLYTSIYKNAQTTNAHSTNKINNFHNMIQKYNNYTNNSNAMHRHDYKI
jgi:hypothetical protein